MARTKRVTVSVSEQTHQRMKEAAEDVGLSVNAWCAHTLGSAAANYKRVRDQMSDEMVALLRSALDAGGGDDEPE